MSQKSCRHTVVLSLLSFLQACGAENQSKKFSAKPPKARPCSCNQLRKAAWTKIISFRCLPNASYVDAAVYVNGALFGLMLTSTNFCASCLSQLVACKRVDTPRIHFLAQCPAHCPTQLQMQICPKDRKRGTVQDTVSRALSRAILKANSQNNCKRRTTRDSCGTTVPRTVPRNFKGKSVPRDSSPRLGFYNIKTM